mmetsp:Transcript_66289/g.188052  ORF Transcript_66289/g.188052 Transcript_66289/m.188052 type:complete len:415 (-) Transcript_66289:137-1381(-)
MVRGPLPRRRARGPRPLPLGRRHGVRGPLAPERDRGPGSPHIPGRYRHHRPVRGPRRLRRRLQALGSRVFVHGQAAAQQHPRARRVQVARRPLLRRAVPGRGYAWRGRAHVVRPGGRQPLQGRLRGQPLPRRRCARVVLAGPLRRRVSGGPVPRRWHVRVARQDRCIPRTVGGGRDARPRRPLRRRRRGRRRRTAGRPRARRALRVRRRVQQGPHGGPRARHICVGRRTRGPLQGQLFRQCAPWAWHLHVGRGGHSLGHVRGRLLQQRRAEGLRRRPRVPGRAAGGPGTRQGRAAGRRRPRRRHLARGGVRRGAARGLRASARPRRRRGRGAAARLLRPAPARRGGRSVAETGAAARVRRGDGAQGQRGRCIVRERRRVHRPPAGRQEARARHVRLRRSDRLQRRLGRRRKRWH